MSAFAFSIFVFGACSYSCIVCLVFLPVWVSFSCSSNVCIVFAVGVVFVYAVSDRLRVCVFVCVCVRVCGWVRERFRGSVPCVMFFVCTCVVFVCLWCMWYLYVGCLCLCAFEVCVCGLCGVYVGVVSVLCLWCVCLCVKDMSVCVYVCLCVYGIDVVLCVMCMRCLCVCVVL